MPLFVTFGNKAPHKVTICRWFNEFYSAYFSLAYELCRGRSKAAAVSENIEAVRELIMQSIDAMKFRQHQGLVSGAYSRIYKA